ncbi:hypothetical protein CPB85DRAFT_186529 [Mucidula mucida]|nr:hypothetical protein CPB85DRAFT_186529 [Mucidula mucida]
MHASRPIDYFVDPSRRPSSDALFDDASADLQTTLDSADYAILSPYLEDSEDKPDLAEMARLVDDLATRYPILPYIVVRAADMRLQLGSPATAMELYKTLLDGPARDVPGYREWFEDSLEVAVIRAAFYKSPAKGGQRWRSAKTAQLPGSHLDTPRSMFDRLRNRWRDMNEDGTASKYGRYHCICTNIIDGAFALTPEVLSSPLPLLLMHTSLHQAISKISNGDYDAVSEGDLLLSVDATVQDVGTVLKILHDTDQALQDVISTSQSEAPITPEWVCAVHGKLMRTQQILPTTQVELQPKSGVFKGGTVTPPSWPVTYVNVGMTRARSKKTVALLTQSGAHTQFCPFWSVDEELEEICSVFTRALADSLDPFALSAWISDVFVSLHPFDAGNGRMARLLASIPLLRAGLPLVNVPPHRRAALRQHLNAVSDGCFCYTLIC